MSDLDTIAVAAMRLQNAYALAIDTRDWDLFRDVFAEDVDAVYPNRRYDGIDDWLSDFIPVHAGFRWTQHFMSTHHVGEDEQGVWATCYGFVDWIDSRDAQTLNHAHALYRDRLHLHDGRWVIARRQLDVVMSRHEPIADQQMFPHSVHALLSKEVGP